MTALPRITRFPDASTSANTEDITRLPRLSDSSTRPGTIGNDALYGLVGEVVCAIDPHTEADPAAVQLSFIAAVGNAMGRGPHARAEGDIHAANFYVAIVGDTSKGRKGTSWGQPRRIVTKAAPDWEGQIAGGLSTGEGLIWAVRDEIRSRRRARTKEEREIAEDGYITETDDAGVDDKRLLVVESEFASTLRVMRRDSNTLSAVLRNGWDRGDIRIMTKSSPAKTTGAHISVIAHISREELARELTATDSANGFANRFLWTYSQRSKLLPDGGSIPDHQIDGLAGEVAKAIEWAKTPRELQRSSAASDLWHDVYGPLSEGQSGMVGAITSRAEAQVLRLSVLYAALDRSKHIDLPHLKAALAVWDYCAASAAYIFEDQSGDPVADKIRQLLEREPGGLTRNEIRDRLSRHISAQSLTRSIDLLVDTGVTYIRPEATGGRPAHRIRLCGRSESAVSAGTVNDDAYGNAR